MAVFTKLDRKDIDDFILNYNIGKLDTYDEIVEGIENTNYKITCNNTPYILTIFEKRVKEEELPFFVDLKLYLKNNHFKCPKPIKNNEGQIINSIKNKRAIIISFIEGKKIDTPNVNECIEVGKMIANLHNLTMNFDQKRENTLGIKEWKYLLSKCNNVTNNKFEKQLKSLEKEISYLENCWPENLPSGVIHADLFKDNIFFMKEKITGVIDFYFSCNHYYLYDISIVINDWCFENNGESLNNNLFIAVVKGYNSVRKLTDEEIKVFNILLRAAAVRILVTRLHDYIFHPKDAIVVKKDPNQYFNILTWHQNNKVINI